MHEYLVNQVPQASRSWVESLLGTSDEASLRRFLQWHSHDSLGELFAGLPPWPPPSWHSFIRYGIPDWPPVVQGNTSYIPPVELRQLRDLAWEIAGEGSSQRDAVYRIFCWVSENVIWSATWGTVTPSEIIARRSGNSFHIAQLVAALCRALFVPARLVEEIAFIPAVWRHQAKRVWHDVPPELCTWLGDRTFFHPFCEVQISNRWQPVDAQRAQFGLAEVQQHIRVPDLLKLVVRSWEDYGHRIDRTSIYTLRPLIGAQRDQTALTFTDDLRAFKRLMTGHLEDGHAGVAGHHDLLDRIQLHARCLWKQQSRKRSFSLVLDKAIPSSASINLQAAVSAPLLSKASLTELKRLPHERLIFVGVSAARMVTVNCRELLGAGTRALILYESWGEGEHAIRSLLATLGANLADWVSPPGDGRRCWQVLGTGHLASIMPWPCTLDLTLTRGIDPPAGNDGTIIANNAAQQRTRVIGTTLRVGHGRLTVVPIAVASLANPYDVSVLSGFHRRMLGALANL